MVSYTFPQDCAEQLWLGCLVGGLDEFPRPPLRLRCGCVVSTNEGCCSMVGGGRGVVFQFPRDSVVGKDKGCRLETGTRYVQTPG